MGKGTIISGGDRGLYQLRINYYRDNIDAQISELNAKITDIDAKIAAKEADIDSLTAQISAANDKPTLQTDLEFQLTAAMRRRSAMILQRLSWRKRIQYLTDNMPEDEEISAWCADLSEELTGVVGTVEVPGERGTILIKPGFVSAAYDAERDGQLEPCVAGHAAGVFWNFAMLPGWQKWMPTYRFGRITSINNENDTCNLDLEEALSSAQGLNINQTETLSNVPIHYMDNDSGDFNEMDDVLVEFQNQRWDQPRVIGFKDEPSAGSYFEYFGDKGSPTDRVWGKYTTAAGSYQSPPGTIDDLSGLDGESLVAKCTLTIPALSKSKYGPNYAYAGLYWYNYFNEEIIRNRRWLVIRLKQNLVALSGAPTNGYYHVRLFISTWDNRTSQALGAVFLLTGFVSSGYQILAIDGMTRDLEEYLGGPRLTPTHIGSVSVECYAGAASTKTTGTSGYSVSFDTVIDSIETMGRINDLPEETIFVDKSGNPIPRPT